MTRSHLRHPKRTAKRGLQWITDLLVALDDEAKSFILLDKTINLRLKTEDDPIIVLVLPTHTSPSFDFFFVSFNNVRDLPFVLFNQG